MNVYLAGMMLLAVGWGAGSAGAEEVVLDDFGYRSVDAARAVWRPAEASPPVEVAAQGPVKALQLPCRFAQDDRRSAYDRSGEWNLSGCTRFTVELNVPQPAALHHFSIYFRSGEGWLGFHPGVNEAGWHTLHLDVASAYAEGKTDGWEKITGIRLSAWKGADLDTVCQVGRLVAHRDRIAIVKDVATVDPQARVAATLRRHGIYAGLVKEGELPDAVLAGKSLVILPGNPYLSAEAAGRLARFAGAGGKILAYSTLAPVVAQALGIRVAAPVAGAPAASCPSFRLDAADIRGLPARVAQAGPGAVRVDAAGARAIGQWLDGSGAATGGPAVLLSAAGAYVGASPGREDEAGQEWLLLALAGHLVPEVWETAAKTALDGHSRVGHLAREALAGWVAAHAPDAAVRARCTRLVAEADGLGKRIPAAVKARDWPAAVRLGRERDGKLEHAYLLAHRARPGEFRACWEHGGQGAYGDWEKCMRGLAENGFNAIITNCVRGGCAQYRSKLLPVSPVVAEKGDQVAAAVAAGRKYGVEVHVWKVNFWGWDTPKEFTEKMRAEGRFQVGKDGKEQEWLCPSHPANQELEIGSMVEVAANYAVAGVHFDYIRYEGDVYCYCQGCRQRFAKATGIRVEKWPADTEKPEVAEKWLEWRSEQITHIVGETSRRVHAVRPECKVSAAVFAQPSARGGIGQDWVRWAREGLVDFLCPMDYDESDYTFAQKVATQLRLVGGRVPIYPGIGAATLRKSPLVAPRVAGQIALARAMGAGGFTLFNYDPWLGDKILPGLGLGVTRGKTSVPHHGPRFECAPAGQEDAATGFARLTPGAAVDVTLRVAAGGPALQGFSGRIALETPDGVVVKALGEITSRSPEARVRFKAPAGGLYLLSVSGRAERAGGGTTPFTWRLRVLQCGAAQPEYAALLPVGK